MNILGFFASWAPVGIWAGLIYFLSSVPNLSSGLGTWDVFLRKGAHVFEYAVLTGLLWRAARRSWPHWSWACTARMSALLAILYAVSDEVHQSFVPGRGPSAVDVVIDSIGVVIAIALIRRMKVYE